MKRRVDDFKLTPSMVLKRGHYGYFFYYWVYTRLHDYRIAGCSLEGTRFNSLPGAYPVQCLSYPYLRELCRQVSFSETDVFVDVGCAWGRVLGYLRQKTPLGHLFGVEYNTEVARQTEEFFKDDPAVTIFAGDATEYIPREGTVYYLFNPFDAATMARFLQRLEQNAVEPVRLLYLHPTCKQVIEARAPAWRHERTIWLRPKHLGPLELCIYSLEHHKSDTVATK